MFGNVWELTDDWYAADYDLTQTKDPKGPTKGTTKVGRGGSWYGSKLVCRSAARGSWAPGNSNEMLGFRLTLRKVE
jgi:formylglycine-generating enzyme required for sulfatase activity